MRLNLYSPTSLKGKDRKRCSEKQKTNESAESIAEREEEPYVIVSKLKMQNSAPNGCKLLPGMIIKLGRIEYYVSEYNDGNMRMTAR